MGRKAREERQERREDFAAKRTQAKRKTSLMAIGILAVSYTHLTLPTILLV